MKLLFILFLFFLSGSFTIAQGSLSRQAISLESVGMGGWTSLNYDYRFKYTSRNFFDARAGFGIVGFSPFSYSIPLSLTNNYHIGSKNHFIEIGVSGSFVFRKDFDNSLQRNYALLSPVIGYQSISPKGFQFRVFLIYPFSNETGSLRSIFLGPLPVIGIGKVIGKK